MTPKMEVENVLKTMFLRLDLMQRTLVEVNLQAVTEDDFLKVWEAVGRTLFRNFRLTPNSQWVQGNLRIESTEPL